MRSREWMALAALVVAAMACNGGGDDDDDATVTPAGTPLFAADIMPIINQTCGTTNNLCHTRVAYGAASAEDCRGWLSLEDASLGSQVYGGMNDGDPTGCIDRPVYERLTAAGLSDAWECGPPAQAASAKVPYVVPGDSAASYLYRKINGGPYCIPDGGGASDPMPVDAPLDPITIEVIRRWIDGGALP